MITWQNLLYFVIIHTLLGVLGFWGRCYLWGYNKRDDRQDVLITILFWSPIFLAFIAYKFFFAYLDKLCRNILTDIINMGKNLENKGKQRRNKKKNKMDPRGFYTWFL